MQASSNALVRRIAAVLLGGFCGTLTRYLLSLLVQGYLGKSWPYDILLINISGALVLALITVLADATFLIGPTRRLFLGVGFLGAYTTFSSLALGDVLLFTAGRIVPALLYLTISLGGGILAIWLGSWLGQLCLKHLRRRPAEAKVTKKLLELAEYEPERGQEESEEVRKQPGA